MSVLSFLLFLFLFLFVFFSIFCVLSFAISLVSLSLCFSLSVSFYICLSSSFFFFCLLDSFIFLLLSFFCFLFSLFSFSFILSLSLSSSPCLSLAFPFSFLMSLLFFFCFYKYFLLSFSFSLSLSFSLYTGPCKTSVPVVAKVLRLSQNLYLTMRKCCACHEINTSDCQSQSLSLSRKLSANKLPRLPRNLRLRLPKARKLVSRSEHVRAKGQGSETVPRPFRTRSETVSSGVATGVAFSQPEKPAPAPGCSLGDLHSCATRMFLACISSYLCAELPSISVRGSSR